MKGNRTSMSLKTFFLNWRFKWSCSWFPLYSLLFWEPIKQRDTSPKGVLEKRLDYRRSCWDPVPAWAQMTINNTAQSCCKFGILHCILPETHTSSRPLSLSHIPVASLLLFQPWITVIHSPVIFSWVITGVQSGRLASLISHLVYI